MFDIPAALNHGQFGSVFVKVSYSESNVHKIYTGNNFVDNFDLSFGLNLIKSNQSSALYFNRQRNNLRHNHKNITFWNELKISRESCLGNVWPI